jgi:hypothetical protein
VTIDANLHCCECRSPLAASLPGVTPAAGLAPTTLPSAAVVLVANFSNTAAQFQAVQTAFTAGIANVTSASPLQARQRDST